MKVCCIEHVPFEGPGAIAGWMRARGHCFERLLMGRDGLPGLHAFDWLVIMGGPMGANDEAIHPWMAAEKRLVAEAIAQGKIVLGVCLGAQIVARVLGARVFPNAHKEIGWFPVHLTDEAASSRIFSGLPRTFTPFHWHGDTFSLPDGARRIAWSEGCANQAFEYEERVVGLQFHLESTGEGIGELAQHCGAEFVDGPYIQKAGDLLAPKSGLPALGGILETLLGNMEAALGAARASRAADRSIP